MGMMHACMHEWQVGLACGLFLGASGAFGVNVCMHVLLHECRGWEYGYNHENIQGTVKCKQDDAIVNRAI